MKGYDTISTLIIVFQVNRVSEHLYRWQYIFSQWSPVQVTVYIDSMITCTGDSIYWLNEHLYRWQYIFSQWSPVQVTAYIDSMSTCTGDSIYSASEHLYRWQYTVIKLEFCTVDYITLTCVRHMEATNSKVGHNCRFYIKGDNSVYM